MTATPPPPPIWDRYVDLENSLVRIHYKNGTSAIRPMPVLSRRDFDRLCISQQDCLRLPSATPVSDEHNRRYRVIRKTLTAPQMNRHHIPLSAYYDNARVAGITTGFKSSDRVESLAQPVLQTLGESYAAVHFRRIGAAAFFAQVKAPLLGLTCGLFPAVSMRDLKRWVPPDTPLYFMSDHHRGAYAERLGKHFNVFTWRRFPELKRLLPRDGTPPDNYLLAQVEYRIFASAGIKIGTHETDSHPPITRYLMMAGKQPDAALPVSLIRDSGNRFVRLAGHAARSLGALKRWRRRSRMKQ